MSNDSMHWADKAALDIIRRNNKSEYTCASGITPSGTVHIGNFREIISTELVVRALKRRGKKVRFIYSWDDYDVFRKVPSNMPNQELLRSFLRFPITSVPDTSRTQAGSYARKNELEVEDLLPHLGIRPEYIYQSCRYKSSYYADDIRYVLENKAKIIEILNKFRETSLDNSWWPISVFSSFTGRDNTTVISYDGEWGITYRDDEVNKEETVDLRKTSIVKLNWRIDWPMRWAKEGVDFEPAGKDHHTSGGSFDTSKEIIKLFGEKAPYSFQYDFISIKGQGGKISSSSGNVISLFDVLEIYTPEVTRFMFAKTRPNTEFAISFDTDVFKIYEDYENTERLAFSSDTNEKQAKAFRIYELSQVDKMPKTISYQIPFRHLCNLLLINSFDINKTISMLKDVKSDQLYRLKQKCECAKNWLKKYADSEFTWSLSDSNTQKPELSENEKEAISLLADVVDNMDNLSEKELSNKIYAVAEKSGMDSKDLFRVSYMMLIGREKGPRLANFLKQIGKDKVLEILRR